MPALVRGRHLLAHAFSSCPPNCLRIAESSLSAKSASPRELKRSKRAAVEHVGRHALVDRGGDRPAALARVGDAARRSRRGRGSSCSAAAVRSSSHDAMTLPRRQTSATARCRCRTGSTRGRAAAWSRRRASLLALADVGVLQDVEALGVRGHDPVLDAVVDHLHEVAGAARARSAGSRCSGVRPGRPCGPACAATARGRARARKIGSRRRTASSLAADHQAVAALEPEDAAARADVDVVDPRSARAPRRASMSSR